MVESSDCCSICMQHNGKIYDIRNKSSIELPPYHPNCRGSIEAIEEKGYVEKVNKHDMRQLLSWVWKKIPQTLIINSEIFWQKKDILKQLWISSQWYKQVMNSGWIKHIFDRHGVNAKLSRWEIGVKYSDIKLIPEIINNYDTINISDKLTNRWNNAIIYKKIIGNHLYTYIESINIKKQLLETQTFYISKLKKK